MDDPPLLGLNEPVTCSIADREVLGAPSSVTRMLMPRRPWVIGAALGALALVTTTACGYVVDANPVPSATSSTIPAVIDGPAKSAPSGSGATSPTSPGQNGSSDANTSTTLFSSQSFSNPDDLEPFCRAVFDVLDAGNDLAQLPANVRPPTVADAMRKAANALDKARPLAPPELQSSIDELATEARTTATGIDAAPDGIVAMSLVRDYFSQIDGTLQSFRVTALDRCGPEVLGIA